MNELGFNSTQTLVTQAQATVINSRHRLNNNINNKLYIYIIFISAPRFREAEEFVFMVASQFD